MHSIDRSDVQGNVLSGYTFRFSKLILAQFKPGSGKRAIAALARHITWATKWNGSRPKCAVNLGVSYSGLEALRIPAHLIAELPTTFKSGMRARASHLGDDPQSYSEAWSQPIHVWIWIHASDDASLRSCLERIERDCFAYLKQLEALPGERLYNAEKQLIEHFGFRDGISQPALADGMTQARQGDGTFTPEGSWRPLATGEFLLGHVDETGEVSSAGNYPELTNNGTFAVLRQLEQNVSEFRKYLDAQAEALSKLKGTPKNAQAWIAERMVGRRRDGSPLHVHSQALREPDINAFTFRDDREGRVCPLGSHIRRANPRDGETFHDSFARHRILRRSIPYGTRYDENAPEKSGRGILFVALNASLERQFEFLQRLYMNDGSASGQGSDVDPLVGAAANGNFVIPGDAQADRETFICARVPQFVTCRGGEYFLLPGRRALEFIHAEALDVSTEHEPAFFRGNVGNDSP